MTSKPIKVAVTGASGFIGRHVLRELSGLCSSTVAVTRDKTQLSEFNEQAIIIEYDLTQSNDQVFDHFGRPDILMHLAWDGLPHYSSLHHFESELPCQYIFLRRMVSQGLKSLLVAGTCFEYGMQFGPLAENLDTKPTNAYGFAKDTLRRQLVYLKQNSFFNLIWARLFYLYGEGQAGGSLLPQLKTAIDSESGVFNMSGGEQLRDFLHVRSVAKSLVALALKQRDVGVVNICSGKPQSVRSIVEKWISEYKSNIQLNLGYYPYPEYEPMAFWGDASKLNKIITNDDA